MYVVLAFVGVEYLPDILCGKKTVLSRTNAIVDLEVAYELSGCLNTEISDKKFDEACSLIKETYLKYEDLTIWAVTTALLDMTEDLEQADLTAITRRELGDKACYYL